MPTPPLGFVLAAGSDVLLVIVDGKFVRFAPDTAGRVAGNLASAIVPVSLLAFNAPILASVIVPSAISAATTVPSAILAAVIESSVISVSYTHLTLPTKA